MYGGRDEACPVCTGAGRDVSGLYGGREEAPAEQPAAERRARAVEVIPEARRLGAGQQAVVADLLQHLGRKGAGS